MGERTRAEEFMTRLKWETPATAYPNTKVGKARLYKCRRSANQTFWAEGMKGYFYYRYVPGHNKITVLSIDGQTWMTDEPPYYWSMEHFGQAAKGSVLVAGLGLGLVVHCLVKNPDVTKITVIDRERDVIKLITPFLPKDPRIEIIEDDFYRFMFEKDSRQRDTLIWDLGLKTSDDWEAGKEWMWLIAPIAQDIYGKDIQVFRHGFDRDPAGEELIRTERWLRIRETL